MSNISGVIKCTIYQPLDIYRSSQLMNGIVASKAQDLSEHN